MEAIGGILSLVSLVAFITGVIALIRPIRRLGLGSRKSATLVTAASVVMFFVGTSLLPAAPQPVPARDANGQEDAATPNLGVTRDEVIQRVNIEWAEMNRPGAFSKKSEELIDDGPWLGGSSYTDCSSRHVCMTMIALPSGKLISATSMATGDGTLGSGIEALAAHIALLRTFAVGVDKEAISSVILEGMEGAEAAGQAPFAKETYGHCLTWLKSEALGMTVFEVSPLPCDEGRS